MIRVLIADDSRATQRILVSLLHDEPGIEVVGVASTGKEAVEMCRALQPDLVTMDVFMPEMDGLEATRQIMKEMPTRIVIVSSMVNPKDLRTSFEAMRSGAVEVIAKPTGVLRGDYTEVKSALIEVIKQIVHAAPQARISSVAKRDSSASSNEPPSAVSQAPSASSLLPSSMERSLAPSGLMLEVIPETYFPSIICIGGSTGAPAVLVGILSTLPADFPVPVVVVQHIARGFINGLVDWLNSSIKLSVKLASDGLVMRPRTVYVAPDDRHVKFVVKNRIALLEPMAGFQYTPSVDILFASAADQFGPRALGVILTGMGRDGAKGLLKLRKSGGVTLAQDESTSIVYGMPKVAVDSGAVVKSMTPKEIGALLCRVGKQAS